VLQPSTYGFLVRPGLEQVARNGGLHAFFNWSGPVLTDSGGIVPAESWGRPGTPAGRVIKVDDDGLVVSSYLDGSPIRITPESSIAAQVAIGGDALTALTPPASTRTRDLRRVRTWAERALAARSDPRQAVLLQAVEPADLDVLGELDFSGVVSDHLLLIEAADKFARLGRSTDQTLMRIWTGHAAPQDAVRAVRARVDVISGSAAVQLAGVGRAWTSQGELDLTDRALERQYGPLESGCACPTCTGGFARGYLHHLFRAEELLGPTLVTVHNVHVLTTEVARARAAAAD
jgi:queuine tRNA-ribosyltransferase